MRRLGLLVLAAVALLAAAPSTVTAQTGGPSLSQLYRALLTEDDIWENLDDSDLVEDDSGQIDAPYPGVYIDLVGALSDDFVTIELNDARNGSPDFISRRLLNNLDAENVREVTPTGYGTAGVRFRYTVVERNGDVWYGEVAAWRQGQVVVAVGIESLDADACVCDYAKLQFNKVAATFR